MAAAMWERANDTADNEFVETWIDDGVLTVATTGDSSPLEAALSEVDFRAKQVNDGDALLPTRRRPATQCW